jgi:hypothetical protein
MNQPFYMPKYHGFARQEVQAFWGHLGGHASRSFADHAFPRNMLGILLKSSYRTLRFRGYL